ncbi:hypothetical protein PC114_g2283 [Phytophthora cactorum]|nr:hypothetical protein PC114_g2283 [Phytophthora cactorum]
MTSQAPVILNRAGAMVCHPITVSDSSRRQTKVNVGAPLKERTRGLIDASAGTTKQGEATVVNDLTLSAGSVITVAEASDRVWPSCEQYRHRQGFVKSVRAKEDNSGIPAELRTFIDEGHLNQVLTGLGPNGLPQLTSPPVEARSIFAFVACSELLDEDLENGQTTENGDYYDGTFADGGGNEND